MAKGLLCRLSDLPERGPWVASDKLLSLSELPLHHGDCESLVSLGIPYSVFIHKAHRQEKKRAREMIRSCVGEVA